MDIFFQDPTAIPLPPKEVRIQALRAETWPDNRRVKVFLEITPFQKRPNAEVNVTNPEGDEVASASIIENISARIEFNLHLRGDISPGTYHLAAKIYYEVEPENPETPPGEREKMVVDQSVISFVIEEPGGVSP
jgi:hypothetical protein